MPDASADAAIARFAVPVIGVLPLSVRVKLSPVFLPRVTLAVCGASAETTVCTNGGAIVSDGPVALLVLFDESVTDATIVYVPAVTSGNDVILIASSSQDNLTRW